MARRVGVAHCEETKLVFLMVKQHFRCYAFPLDQLRELGETELTLILLGGTM